MMHGRAAQELHVEVPHVELAPAGLADQGERLDQQPIERLAAAGPVAKRQACLLQVEVALLHERLFERRDLRDIGRPLRHRTANRGTDLRVEVAQVVAEGCHDEV